MLSFANPWGLLALLAVPAVIAIHFYRRRFPRLPVAGAFLWGGTADRHDAGRTRSRLPITATLLLEVLAAALLALLLAQPRWSGAGRVEHWVIVLDDSASMGAIRPTGDTVRDAVLAELAERVESLGRRDVVTVILTGKRPTLLAGPAASWSAARERLHAWNPQAIQHDPSTAWDLAAQLGGDDGRLLYLTDQLPANDLPLPEAMEVISLGHPQGNVALTAARWRLDSLTGRGTISLRVERHGTAVEPVTLTGRTGDTEVFTQVIDVPAGGSTPIEFEVPGGLGTLTITVMSRDDALPIDSTLTLVEPDRRTVRIAMELPDDHPATKPFRRVFEHLPAIEFVTVDQADLVVTRGDTLPVADDELWWLGVGTGGDADSAPPVDLAGPFVIDKREPLTDGLLLEGVDWGGVRDVKAAVTPLITSGPYPLLSRLVGTPTKAYLLNIDMQRSNLADSPDWPILIANVVSAVRDDQPGLRRWNYRSGEPIILRLSNDSARADGDLTLVGPDGGRTVILSRVVEISPPATPGLYKLRSKTGSVAAFAVNFQDAVESDLNAASTDHRAPSRPLNARGFIPDTIYSWPVLAAIACVIGIVVGDWYVLRPR